MNRSDVAATALLSLSLFAAAAGCTSTVYEDMPPDPRGVGIGRAETDPERESESESGGSDNGSVAMMPPHAGDAGANANTNTEEDASDGSDASTPDSSASDAGSTPDATVVVVPPPPVVVVPNAKRVFETSHYFSGNLKAEGMASSGLEGADVLCNSAALAAGIGGGGSATSWRAWLSAPGVNAKDRIVDVSPWYLVDRSTLVFDKKVGLGVGSLVPQAPGIDVGPRVNIDMNELGVTNSPVNDWTGTEKTGVASPFTCKGWTTNLQTGGEGLVGIGIYSNLTWWTDSVTNPCSLKARLICFEQ